MTVKELSDLLAKLPPDMLVALEDDGNYHIGNTVLDIVHLYQDGGDLVSWCKMDGMEKTRPKDLFDSCCFGFSESWPRLSDDVIVKQSRQRIDDYLKSLMKEGRKR